jgi:hypothetical protein
MIFIVSFLAQLCLDWGLGTGKICIGIHKELGIGKLFAIAQSSPLAQNIVVVYLTYNLWNVGLSSWSDSETLRFGKASTFQPVVILNYSRLYISYLEKVLEIIRIQAEILNPKLL